MLPDYKLTALPLFLLGWVLIQPASADPPSIPDYDTARSLFWSQIYPDGGETLYCGVKFGRHRGKNINVEHVFPMGWVIRSLKCGTRWRCRERSPQFNRIEADMHNLYPSLERINHARGAFRYGMVRGEARKFGKNCDFEVDFRNRSVEPRNAVRGNIARAMFYMKETYDLVIFAKLGRLLLEWNQADPPDAEEKRRNDRIERVQGKRNPFIDDPGRARKLRF